MIRSKGFSLVELTVALFIIALLLAGAFIPLSTQMEVRNVAETQRSMESTRDAIIGFAQANGRLPCPANGATPAGTVDTTTWATPVGAGAEQWDPANTRCYTVFGVVPWTSLGVSETDAWGRRLSYRVSPAFADAISLNTWQSRQSAVPGPGTFLPQQFATFTPSPADQAPTCPGSSPPAVAPFVLSPAPALSSFALCSLGDIAVFTRGNATTTAVPLGTALPAVFISHGKNGFGAWQPNGIRLAPVPSGNDEAANVNGNTTATPQPSPPGYTSWAFYSRTRAPAAGGCVDPVPGTTNAAPSCEFDDIVVMITTNALIARMVAAGKLP
jgi:prepilin-type N-terminal cleavage/methylation domain-containing protein